MNTTYQTSQAIAKKLTVSKARLTLLISFSLLTYFLTVYSSILGVLSNLKNNHHALDSGFWSSWLGQNLNTQLKIEAIVFILSGPVILMNIIALLLNFKLNKKRLKINKYVLIMSLLINVSAAIYFWFNW